MDMDQVIFAALAAINEKWTAHVGESESSRSDMNERKGDTRTAELEEMKQKIKLQDSNIASQQEEMVRQKDEIAFLREAVQKLQETQSTVTSTSELIPQCAEGVLYDSSKVEDTASHDGVTMPFTDMAVEAEAEAEESPVAAATSIDDFNDNATMSLDFEKESH